VSAVLPTGSIVSIFLFWPLAIPAIINASKVDPLIGLVGWAVGIVCCIVHFVVIIGSTANAKHLTVASRGA
jgi:hypothetical protein